MLKAIKGNRLKITLKPANTENINNKFKSAEIEKRIIQVVPNLLLLTTIK